MASQFLFNIALWCELETRIPRAKKVRAAVAYLGTGGATLLPLRDGDALVVDMSLARVRSGATDPREVKKLLNRGVSVFSRGSLHAKFLIIDTVVIAGSSNISNHAKSQLDEAAVLTDDASTVRRAIATFDKLCTEPVRKDYLAKCLDEYRPPRFAPKGGKIGRGSRRKKVVQSKLVLLAGLRYSELPEAEEGYAKDAVGRASKRLRDFEKCEVDFSHYPSRASFFSSLREGDWIVQCIRDGKGYDVLAPSRFIGIESYPRGGGKRRYLLLLERPQGVDPTRWKTFRARAPFRLPSTPKRLVVPDEADADAILRMWDARGNFKKPRGS